MKILIVRFSSIGDVVLTTPVVRCVKQQLKAEVHFITKKAFASVLELNPYIDKLHVIEKSIDERIADLKSENFDLIIDLHNNVRTASLKRKLGVKSYAFPKKNIAKLLLTTFKVNRMPKVHVVHRYFQAVSKIGVINDNASGDFFLSDNDKVDLTPFNLVDKPFIAVAMGAQFATKQLPIDLMVTSLNEQNVPIVLLGGTMDSERSAALKSALNSHIVVDFCGKITLRQSAYLLKQASVLLTGDTGLMHIASCFDTPIVSVWGNTVPDLGMYVYSPKNPESYSIHEVTNLKCRPCSKIGYQSCPKKHFKCMSEQNPKAIATDLKNRLEHRN